MEKLRAGIIGTGMATGISMAHYRGYQKSSSAEVTAVYNRTLSSAQKWCTENGVSDVRVCESLEEFFDLVDAVSICTPNYAHADYVKRCLAAGKHVLCEKPVGAGDTDLAELEAVCAGHRTVAMVNFNYRRTPGIRRLAELVGEGRLGEIVLYRHTMGGGRLINESIGYEWRMDREKSGCGALGDFGCHILDTMLFVLGASAESVRDYGALEKIQIKARPFQGSLRPVENDDCSIVQGIAGNGTLFSFMTSRIGALGNCLEVIGTRGIAKFTAQRPMELEIEFREEGRGYTGQSVRLQEEDGAFAGLMDAGTRVDIAACIDNVGEFVNRIIRQEEAPSTISHGIKIEELIRKMDKGALKL